MSRELDSLPGSWRRTGWRLLKAFVIVLFAGIALNTLILMIARQAGGFTVSLTVLCGLPFFLSALTAYLVKPNAGGFGGYYYWVPVWVTMGVLLLGGLLLREGAVCIIMVLPLWLPMAIWGSLTVRRYQREANQGADQLSVFDLNPLVFVPMVIIGMDIALPQAVSNYEVRRSIVLDASPDEIWPLLLKLDDISSDEGGWNLTQSVLQIPRPVSAVVTGTGEGAVRKAQWGANIRFEEHITSWDEGRHLSWQFVFPDDSISAYTDRHIHPEGQHLRLGEGGYDLELLGDGRTKLTLYTQYEAETPVNLYAALWGELFLGDIQSNILAILDQRLAENFLEN